VLGELVPERFNHPLYALCHIAGILFSCIFAQYFLQSYETGIYGYRPTLHIDLYLASHVKPEIYETNLHQEQSHNLHNAVKQNFGQLLLKHILLLAHFKVSDLVAVIFDFDDDIFLRPAWS